VLLPRLSPRRWSPRPCWSGAPVAGVGGRLDCRRAAEVGWSVARLAIMEETVRMGIAVNSVAPGYVSIEMVQAVPKAALVKVIAKIPVGRLGEPDEIARVVEFLADPDSAFITGQIYSVNGGQYM
jgi:NAD(P)-dependent dehydrogenase (short-subunit alcohol dehydrogenase family)